MSGIMILLLAGLTAFAFIVVNLRRSQTSRPLRGILLLVAAAIVSYIVWIFVSGLMKSP
jgi:ABC-type transport system involved in cytochrome c biogenesis permease subunit